MVSQSWNEQEQRKGHLAGHQHFAQQHAETDTLSYRFRRTADKQKKGAKMH